MFNLEKLFLDVFHPEQGEHLVVVCDVPHDKCADNSLWRERRTMAVEWHRTLERVGSQVGFSVAPLITFPASGAHNGDLPLDDGHPVSLREALDKATIALALTEFSPTAPMVAWAKTHPDFRVATLPGVARRTENTALSADYSEVARRCVILRDLLEKAEAARVLFSTGHVLEVDLRYRKALMDDGQLPRKANGGLINLPSGESFQVPYEGERPGEPSRTAGEIPVTEGEEMVVYRVEGNRVVAVNGGGPAKMRQAYFAEDPARANIAEFAFGCNPEAVVWDNVLEDEKAGFHWAYGRSEHLGGTVGPDSFAGPETIVHQDIVYARDSSIQVTSVVLSGGDHEPVEVIRDGDYIVF
jgi:hypothetical protein